MSWLEVVVAERFLLDDTLLNLLDLQCYRRELTPRAIQGRFILELRNILLRTRASKLHALIFLI